MTYSKHPKVSVIIPVYNVDRYLAQCLDSVMTQTLGDIEIICVNDGSFDRSHEILETYAAADNRFVLLNHKNNKGLPSARNTGLDSAKGKFIFFIDSDDFLECSDALETLYNTALEDQADEVIGGVMKWNQETDERFYGWHVNYLEKEIHGSSLVKLPQLYANVVAWNKMLRHSFLRRHKIRFNENIIKHEDNPFSCKVHILANKISIVPKITYIYRQVYNDSLMSTIKKTDAFFRCKYCYDIFEFIESNKSHHRYRKMYYHRYSRQLIESAAILSHFSPSEDEILELLYQWKNIVNLLPQNLPDIPSTHHNIYNSVLKDDFRSAWKNALILIKPDNLPSTMTNPDHGQRWTQLRTELKRQKELNALLQAQIRIVYNSRSWRITAPIRGLLFKIRGY